MIPASAPKTSGSSEASPAAGTEVKLVPSSKKEPSVRQRELLAYLREPLREVCASHAGELMRSKFAGALVLLEAIRVRTLGSSGYEKVRGGGEVLVLVFVLS